MGRRYTYEEIGQELGVSHQRVMEIERIALAKAFDIIIRKGYHPDILFKEEDVSFEKPLHIPELDETYYDGED